MNNTDHSVDCSSGWNYGDRDERDREFSNPNQLFAKGVIVGVCKVMGPLRKGFIERDPFNE